MTKAQFSDLFMSTGKNTKPINLSKLFDSKPDDKTGAFLETLKDCQLEIKVRYGECQEPESSVKKYEGIYYAKWSGTKDALLEYSQKPFGAMGIYEVTRSMDYVIDTEDEVRVCFPWQGSKTEAEIEERIANV